VNIRIFDVAHGFCAYVVADTGNVMLFDCGYKLDGNDDFTPSTFLYETNCVGIEQLIVCNYDEDHIADLPNLRDNFKIDTLRRNKSVTAEQLKQIKEEGGPLSDAMKSLLDMMQTYTGPVTTPIDFGNISTNTFYNNYPTFEDTNNLSCVTFLHYLDVHIVFPGDLEQSGWKALLERDEFRKELQRVHIFVASHHGRESGYEPQVFDYCKPQIVIISDAEHEDTVQKDKYAKHATGMKLSDGGTKRVLTTWQKGMITIEQSSGKGFRIKTER
jgi:beta-lactamase superfamily II metal-dependent hydrolase